jgi:hypothetical protein
MRSGKAELPTRWLFNTHVGGLTARHADHPCGNTLQRCLQALDPARIAVRLLHPPAQRRGVHGRIPKRQKFGCCRRH